MTMDVPRCGVGEKTGVQSNESFKPSRVFTNVFRSDVIKHRDGQFLRLTTESSENVRIGVERSFMNAICMKCT